VANVLYIGDEVTAAGYRLAGVETLVLDAEEGKSALQPAAIGAAELILLSSRLAAALPAEELEQALARVTPLLTIVPDVFGAGAPPDLAVEVRRALGIES
jgi:vacuolar-type H+-ATPase subunit F/Vma7